MNKSKLKITTISVFCLSSCFSYVNASELTPQEDLKNALNSLPELADVYGNKSADKSASVRIKCYVDTPAYDYFSYNNCLSVGSARTTTAVFNLENVPTGSDVIWSNSNCNANSTWCTLPIRQYQQISVTATVLKPDSTFSQHTANAWYEGNF